MTLEICNLSSHSWRCGRVLIALPAAVAIVGVIAWTLFSGGKLPPADFTFINETEVKTLDPSLASGHPENRMINALFEGLVRLHPQDSHPIPGVAARWTISADGLVYTFFLRENAAWSNGTQVTASDFRYSLRRLLDPRTAGEYAYQGWYVKNGRKYSRGVRGIEPGERVEVELNVLGDVPNTVRGELVHGTLVRLEDQQGQPADTENDEADVESWTITIDVDGQVQQYRLVDDDTAGHRKPPDGIRWCRQVLRDFRDVGVKVLDDHTLELTLQHPTPFFLQLVGTYPYFPLLQECVDKHGSPAWTSAENLVGNGPYLMQFRRIRDRIRLVKSPTFWDRDAVRLNTIDALAIDSIVTGLNLYMTGKVDWITDVPPPALRILRQEDPPRKDLNAEPMLVSYFYLLNTTRKPFNDKRVRRALCLALNREEITSKALAAGEIPGRSLVPPGIAGYAPPLCAPENVEEARSLMAAAGYPKGKGFPRIDILYNTHESHQAIAELIRKQWQRHLGISVRTRNEEWGSYLASQRQMNYFVCRKGWVGDYPDPNTFLDMFLSGGEQNNTGFANPKYDGLIRAAKLEKDPVKRLQILREAEQLLMDELPILPIYYYVSKNMVKPHVRGLYNNLLDFHPLSAIWIDHDHQGPNEFMASKVLKGRP